MISAQTPVNYSVEKTIATPLNVEQEKMKKSSIRSFYEGKNILITGATGFLGKVLLWKLLESCHDSGTIYVLLRSKNDQSADKRLIKMLQGAPFVPQFNHEQIIKKVVAIESDITAPSLGLSERDRLTLTSTVNVVFHCAASVKFDAPLKDNIRDNVVGTQGIIELCKQVSNLDSFIHVSTAYSNCHLEVINEDLHELKRNPDDVLKVADCLSSEVCDRITDEIIEGRPNTYTYTKAMAEDLVARESDKLPIGIVRPSIVTSGVKEPIPGWVDNVNGIAGLGVLASIGVLRTIDWNYWAVSDMVPVDSVSNCILVAGQSVSMQWKSQKAQTNDGKQSQEQQQTQRHKLPVYNMTSGNMNPISWGRFFEMLRNEAVEAPTNKVVRPIIHSPRHNRANPASNFATKLFSELLFAYIVDMLIKLLGYKEVMVKITKKMHHAYDILKPFTTRQWVFKSDNVTNLIDTLSPEDKDEFDFDIRKLNWQEYARDVWLGARIMILKEENTQQSIESGKKRLIFVNIVHYIIMAILMSPILYLSYKLVLSTIGQ